MYLSLPRNNNDMCECFVFKKAKNVVQKKKSIKKKIKE